MSTLVVVRHGRSTSNTAGTLAGRLPGVTLDDTGVQQARDLGRRLEGVDLAAVVSSPLERCQQTAQLLLEEVGSSVSISTDDRVVETDYGSWSGRLLHELSKEPLWATVQSQPDQARFPDGEAMTDVAVRVVEAVQEWNNQLAPGAVWVLVSHGDVIASLLGWALGQPFNHVQRLMVDPASASVIHLPGPDATAEFPRVACINTVEGSLKRYAVVPTATQAGVGGGVGASGAAEEQQSPAADSAPLS